jgi:hypothetical protein
MNNGLANGLHGSGSFVWTAFNRGQRDRSVRSRGTREGLYSLFLSLCTTSIFSCRTAIMTGRSMTIQKI